MTAPEAPATTVGSIVRLGEFVGTKAQQRLLWRVVASGRVSGELVIEPVTGGRGLRVNYQLVTAATPAEVAAVAALPEAPKVTLGTVVTLAGKAGAFVVVAMSTAGKVTVAPLNGAGKGSTGYRGLTPAQLRIVQAEVVA